MERQARAGYRPGRLKHHDRQPRQRRVCQSRSAHLAGDATAVTCLFGEGIRNGKPIQRSTASKKARGSMARWMAENKLEDASELTAFNIGYRHIPELSDKNTLVFMNAQAQ
ncbi:peroxide stress protein YaaA [Collinsella aerofaciens]|uniref:peroxide stress protein YaaA n=1 Tax=Collinsella aerofaciens TaxID=74426 RepID=UPI00226C24FB|nr:peroxide stress protein YaaA [Collinsella aerofaciens]